MSLSAKEDVQLRELNFNQAISEAIHQEMARDKSVFVLGEDVTHSIFGVAPGLVPRFGKERVRDTPISESAFVGAGIGAAVMGMRPIIDVAMYSFTYVAADQIIQAAAKMTYMFAGQVKVPVVVLGFNGSLHASAQHADAPHGMYGNAPGLKIVMPSGPYDAKGLLKASIRDDNPVLFFLSMSLGMVKEDVPEEDYVVPLGVASVKRPGSDATVVAMGPMVKSAMKVADDLSKRGRSVEVVDPRSLVPLDKETIFSSVRKTGRLVICDEAPSTCGWAANIAALVAEDDDTFGTLESPILRVTRPDVPSPFSPPLAAYVRPDETRIKAAVERALG